MAKEYNNWKYIEKTPAYGYVYHHKKRKTIMVIYEGEIRLFNDFPEMIEGARIFPALANNSFKRIGKIIQPRN